MQKFLISFLLVVALDTHSTGQPANDTLSFAVNGFTDVFYGYSFQLPSDHQGPSFYYNHNRYNEFSLNLALINLAVKGPRYRANLGIMAGEYPQQNLSAEPALLRHVWQANIGASLNKEKNLWLDAGILPSYIGWESAISMDNLTLTRSIAAENSPYYLAGLQLGWQIAEQWKISGIICNGWQHIRSVNATQWPSFGTQVQYQSIAALGITWNTFIGTDSPDSLGRIRYFSDLFAKASLGKHLTLLGGFDIGFQHAGKNIAQYHCWYSPVVILQYAFKDWGLAWRGEYYSDENGVIIPAETYSGLNIYATSFNIDYQIANGLKLRLEAKYLKRKVVVMEDTLSDFFIISSLAFQWQK